MSHTGHGSSGTAAKERKTLVQQAGVVVIKDPEAHTRHQVSELDKQAKSSTTKKKAKLDEIESDNKKIAQINDQIRQIKMRSVQSLSVALHNTASTPMHVSTARDSS